MKPARTTGFLACLALLPALSMAHDNPGPPGERWKTLDTDGDGAISLAEAEAGAPRLAARFARLDADGDGRLTPQEMAAAREQVRQQAQQRADERWRAADVNGDGYIDLAEAQTGMPRAAENFGRIDADGNGLLSREEMRAAMRERHAERMQRGAGGGQPPGSRVQGAGKPPGGGKRQ